MVQSAIDNELIKKVLSTAKTIAMVGASSTKDEKISATIKRRPSIIVMKYLQEFGYRVIPVNPSSKGKEICGETAVASLEDIIIPINLLKGGSLLFFLKISSFSRNFSGLFLIRLFNVSFSGDKV